jgi:hypothetical protein
MASLSPSCSSCGINTTEFPPGSSVCIDCNGVPCIALCGYPVTIRDSFGLCKHCSCICSVPDCVNRVAPQFSLKSSFICGIHYASLAKEYTRIHPCETISFSRTITMMMMKGTRVPVRDENGLPVPVPNARFCPKCFNTNTNRNN